MSSNKTPEERFWAKVDKSGECWEWIGYRDKDGYGRAPIACISTPAHRASWTFLNGPIPEGKQIDHLCRNRACVKPDHLRIVTPKENLEHVGPHRGSRSGLRGVYWNKSRNSWFVQVMHNGQYYYGGGFTNIQDANEAAVNLRNRLFTHNDLDRRAA
jgi:hypothetical protein